MDLLKTLTNTPGVAGREELIREVIQQYAEQHCRFDEISTDALGSLICRKRPTKHADQPHSPMRVLLAAHMDQVGFLVSGISERGLLSLHPLGSFDPRTLFSTRVSITTESGEVLGGVLNPGGRPIHTASSEELAQVPKLSDFYVDTSLPESVVSDKVRLGDMVVPEGAFEQIGNSVVSRALDNRVGCWALLRSIEDIQDHACDIYAVWTVQEELGSRGAGPVSVGIAPDIGICCDTTVCCDVPGVSKTQHVTRAGAGISIQIADSSTLADRSLVLALERVAHEKEIACQRSLMLGGGQDGALIQRSGTGVRTAVLSCPVKHMHTTAEMVHRDDMTAYRDLITAFLESL